MGTVLQFLIVFLLFKSVSHAEEIKVVKLRGVEAVQAEYCRIETGGKSTNCGMPYGIEKLDVLYVPDSMGKRIEAHVRDAFQKKYYFNLNKVDLFHGHFLARGPHTQYASPKAYFDDIQVSLYHSKEYLHTWDEIPLESSPFVDHPDQRSFVGMFLGDDVGVTAAIDLIRRDLYVEPYPVGFLRGYKVAGTIYSNEVNDSQNYSLHKYQSLGGSEHLYVNTCEGGEKDCEPCRIFTTYVMEQKDGRYLSPDGVRFDVTVHCRYYRK